jgi:hypothetical protein
MSAPHTFRTSLGSYLGLCGVLSVPPLIVAWAVLFAGRVDLTFAVIFLFCLPVTAAIWLAYFRLRIDDSGIEYRDLFGRSFRVAYSEVASLKSSVISYGRGFGYEWILHLHDGRRLRLNLKPFPREVHGLLCRRINCEA